MINPIWHSFPTIEYQLVRLTEYLLKSVNLSNQPIHHKVNELLSASGKMLRPGLFYIFTEFGEPVTADRLRAGAAALELLHVATLVHDDVVDESPMRRNVVTTQVEFGSRNAIYAGDYLFTSYFTQVLRSTTDPTIYNQHISSMQKILAGELNQMNLNYRTDVTQAEYFEEITGKTAELFKLSCQQGAVLTNCSPQIISLAEQIGTTLGQAYQILDDILDYAGDSISTKKPILEDIKAGVYTLPLILAQKNAPTIFGPLLAKGADLSDTEILAIAELVRTNHGIEDAQTVATQLTDKALALIAKLPKQKARANLEKLTRTLLNRKQ